MNTKNITKAIIAASLLAVASAFGAETTFQLYTNSDYLNHWPGPDGLIGTNDDVVSSSFSPINYSAPNSIGSLSYNAFVFPGGQPAESALLPNPMNAATFMQGTVSAQLSGNGVMGCSLSGTEAYPGHGAYSAQIDMINSLSWGANSGTGWSGGTFSVNLNFTVTLTAGTASAVNFDFSGTAYYVSDLANASATGDNYVDSVLVPLGRSLGMKQLLYVRGSGTVPASTGGTGGYFPQMAVTSVIVGFASEPPNPFAGIQANAYSAKDTYIQWINDTAYPWIWHYEHGWWFVYPMSETSAWFYDLSGGWFYTAQGTYPWLYSASRTAWLWYYENPASPPNRVFYDASTSNWITIPKSL